jgi:Na+/H+ antiporter NhaD/arsenite permease-like protein
LRRVCAQRSFARVDSDAINPTPWSILPFGILLGTIAAAPVLAKKWWLKHYAKVSLSLGAITLAYYFFGLHATARILDVAQEYVSFILLIGSLFVVSGGIHINVKGAATPWGNVMFLLTGAVIANVLGTTGASMLLIRPWIRMNQHRIAAHHIVFFIFIISNVGGCLTPIGDPPLFLGYLRGIPFWWVAEHCFPMWAVGLGALLAMFYLVDRINFTRASREVRQRETAANQWRFEGWPNLFYLAVILGAVFIRHPPFLRETLMGLAAAASYVTTRKGIHAVNQFDFHPIREVAILFIGIFATMMPALDWLATHTNPESMAQHGIGTTPGWLYWGTGTLSGVLDNAPTYLSFLSAISGAFINPEVVAQVQAHLVSGTVDFSNLSGIHAEPVRHTLEALQRYHGSDVAAQTVSVDEIKVCFLVGNETFNQYLVALSVGAVFFGAATYIGNGPNFMVKAIADQQQIDAPNFAIFVLKYAVPFLLPMLLLVWWLFFRG